MSSRCSEWCHHSRVVLPSITVCLDSSTNRSANLLATAVSCTVLPATHHQLRILPILAQHPSTARSTTSTTVHHLSQVQTRTPASPNPTAARSPLGRRVGASSRRNVVTSTSSSRATSLWLRSRSWCCSRAQNVCKRCTRDNWQQG